MVLAHWHVHLMEQEAAVVEAIMAVAVVLHVEAEGVVEAVLHGPVV